MARSNGGRQFVSLLRVLERLPGMLVSGLVFSLAMLFRNAMGMRGNVM